jgi:hypothetical protein
LDARIEFFRSKCPGSVLEIERMTNMRDLPISDADWDFLLRLEREEIDRAIVVGCIAHVALHELATRIGVEDHLAARAIPALQDYLRDASRRPTMSMPDHEDFERFFGILDLLGADDSNWVYDAFMERNVDVEDWAAGLQPGEWREAESH